jgi:hypothetical protein
VTTYQKSVETMRDVAIQHKYPQQRRKTMKNRLMKFWTTFVCMAESFGRARAASALARDGYYDLAKQMMAQQKNERC